MSINIDAFLSQQLIVLARQAGEAILAVYNAPEAANIQSKADDSPLTAADLAAHEVIVQGLPSLLDIPLISEESALPPYTERQGWRAYWLIDPLDGTKEFIARNGQFTVNIALVVDGVPRLGVVHVPVSDETYIGIDASIAADGVTRAEKYLAGVKLGDIRTRTIAERVAANAPLDVLVSHRHGTDAVAVLMERLQSRWPAPLNPVSAGSSLKFCKIAEGEADFYPRLAPTCEWDTAAAQAVLCAAGGLVVCADDFSPLSCNSGDSLLNPSFLAMADAGYDWQSLLA